MWGCVIEVTKLAVQDGAVIHWNNRGESHYVHVYMLLLTENQVNIRRVVHGAFLH